MFQSDRRAWLRGGVRSGRAGGFRVWGAAALIAGVGALGVVSLPASAQGGAALPPGILERSGAWSVAEARAVEAFIERHLAAFRGEDAEAIVAAREALLGPLNVIGAEPTFLSQYFRAVAAALQNGLGDFSKFGRINAMMLGPRLVDASVVPVLEAGLSDELAGVRYAAARSIRLVLANEAMGLRSAERARVVGVLGEAASAEPDGYVAGKLIEAIELSDVADERSVLLSVFNERVPLHAADPGLSYQSELSSMQQLFIDGLGTFNPDETRLFMQSAGRYIRLASQQNAMGVLPEENLGFARELVRASYTILNQLAGDLAMAGRTPDNPATFGEADPQRSADLAEQWVAYLVQNPLNFTAEELSIAPAGGLNDG